ncbi:hypothetical protein DEO72_LG8g1425 [Vigna unguiculata]|uniref:Uncharacterized protein n=1 Tax=Vigna unguiculata TaxID=3917 RepID=A0A4D6MRX8_VIGUN|nr:hypothetical protein DEO72_LG8g1425 [Vigna unguiculata]
MQDLDVNCGRIREELDWTTERQEKKLYKLVKEDVIQEEKKGRAFSKAPFEQDRSKRSNETPIGCRRRLPTGPEPSLLNQRASFLKSPVRTGLTQAVKRNLDRVQVPRSPDQPNGRRAELRREMQDLDVNCGRIREELDWTTERQEKKLYKLVKEDVIQEEKKGRAFSKAPFEQDRSKRSNETPIGCRRRLPTGPEPSLLNQRASFLKSPVRTGLTQAVKRNLDRVPTEAPYGTRTKLVRSKGEFPRKPRSNRTDPSGHSTNLAKNSFSMSMGRWADRPTEAPYGTRTKLVRSKGEFPRKPRSNRTDPSGRWADRPTEAPYGTRTKLVRSRGLYNNLAKNSFPMSIGRWADRPTEAPYETPTKPVRSKCELPRKPRSNKTDPSAKNSFSIPMGRWADRPTEAPYGTRTKFVRSKGEFPRKPCSNRTDPSGQTKPR